MERVGAGACLASASVAAALLLLAAGCGGGTAGSGEAIGGKIAKAEFVRKANAICSKAKQRILGQAIPAVRKAEQAGATKHNAELSLVRDVLLPTLEWERDSLAAPGAPPGDEEEVRALLDALREPIREARTEPETYVGAGGGYRAGAIHYGKAARVARDYGLSGCPQG